MGQSNSTQREPTAIIDEFGRITNFFYDNFNVLHLWRNPHPRRAYWEKGEEIFPAFYYFKEYAYLPLETSKPDLGLALAGAIIDMGLDLDGMFSKYGQAFNCWMVLQVHYEPVNPNDETHQGFDAYLSAAPTRIFKRFGIVNGWENPYKTDISILTERIKQVNARFIKYTSGLVLAAI